MYLPHIHRNRIGQLSMSNGFLSIGEIPLEVVSLLKSQPGRNALMVKNACLFN
jgi:hypothetical protein